MARTSTRTTHEDAHDEARHAASAPNANGDGSESLASNDEEAIRAKLRESGWEKKTRKEKDDDAPSAQRKNSNAKDNNDHDHDRERRRGSGSGSARKERRSRSRRRGGDRDRDDRRDRDRDSRRHRDRSAKRGKPSSRRRSSRSRSNSKSHSRSPSKSRRVSSSHHKRRGASPSRSVSRGRGSGSKKSRAHGSKSRSSSLETSQKKKKDEVDTDTDPETDEQQLKSVEQDKVNEKAARVAEKDTAEDMDVDEETAGKKPEGETSKERASSAQRKGRKSSRHSRSKSRSPSRSSRRRRHRSRSRSPSRNSRRRRSSRSRSRSRGRRGSDRRRRRSYTRSRSPSHSRRRRRSSSKDKKRRDANSSPEPHEHPPGVPVAPPLPVPAPVVNPTITQLMQQYPTMSLQDIIAKMQASNVTMAAAVSQKPARELYVGNLPPNVTGPQLQEFLGTIIQQVGLCAQPGNPILNTWISTDGHFAFCEMRSVEECNLALLLNQLSLLGQPLKFGRPRSFMGPPQPMPVVSSRTQTALVNLGCTPNPVWFAQPNLGVTGLGAAPALPIPSMSAAPLPNPYLANPVLAPVAPAPISAALLSSLPADANSKRLLMSNIPVVLVESQVKELVEPFGELKSFTLLMDKITGTSTGNALFEYEDDSVAEEALQGLNNLDIGGIPLSIRRAPQDANGLSPADETSVVVKLANMVSLDELKDDEEFSDLKEDVEEECKRFGKVVDMVIPRPQVNHLVVFYRAFMNANLTCGTRVQDGESVPGVGNIYVRFNEKPEAASAIKALSGRKFGGNIVKVTYYPLAKFESKEFV